MKSFRYQSVRYQSVAQVLEMAASSVPAKPAVIDVNTRTSYGELNEMADALAGSLYRMGFRKGDRLAIYMKNSLELVVAFYACQKLGVVIPWMNPNYRQTEAQFILGNAEAKGIFIFDEWDGYDYLGSILAMKPNLPALGSIFVAGKPKGSGCYSLHDLIQQGRGEEYLPPSIDSENDLAMFLYTSGTTGKPKGAMISHYATIRSGYEYSCGYDATSEDVFLGALPMTHSYGCGAGLIQPFLLKATIVVLPKFDVRTAFQVIEKERITLFPGAPTHFILMLNHPDRKNFDLKSFRAGLCAGYIPPEGLITAVQKEMGVYLTPFWGASEVGPGVGIMCPYPSSLEIRERSIGKPVPETEVRVVDVETRKEMPVGEIGELTLSGWHVMKGYWNNPEETQKQIKDQWLFMGDLVSKDESGYIRIYGRTKDLINRGGFKVYPSELETLISQHPKVQDVCIVATPNPVLGENICVCVVPKPGQNVSLSDIREYLKDLVAPHKLPDELCIMNDFPRLSGGVKINKFGKGGLGEYALNDRNKQIYRRGN